MRVGVCAYVLCVFTIYLHICTYGDFSFILFIVERDIEVPVTSYETLSDLDKFNLSWRVVETTDLWLYLKKSLEISS